MLKITLMLYRPQDPPDGDPAKMIDLARAADDAGLHAVAMGEHVALGASLEDYPYKGGLRQGQDGCYLEPVATLGAFAAVTSRVRLSTSVMLAPLRPAVLLAKQMATLDVLSRGRLEPAFGVGWSREEYAALGVDFAARRRILRDNIAACRAIWGEQPAAFTSETIAFEGIYAMPRPVQARMPILVGLRASDANAALIAEVGDGWEAGPDDSRSVEALREGVAKLRAAFTAAGRDPQTLIVRAYLPLVRADDGELDLERSFAAAAPLTEVGVNRFVLSSGGFGRSTSTTAEFTRLIEKIGRAAAAAG